MFCSKSMGLEYFQNLKKDRELGDAKKNEWTQYFTVFISLMNAIYVSYTLVHTFRNGTPAIFVSPELFYLISIPAMIAGSLFVVWLANQISKFGIGQGTSVIIFANIISNSASSFSRIYNLYKTGVIPTNLLVAIILLFGGLFFTVIYVEACNVFLPTRYTGVTGKYVDQKLPLKINNAGVMPAVLASSLGHFPMMLSGLLEKLSFHTETVNKYISYFSQNGPFYYAFTAILLFVFTTTQSEITFDPSEISQNLQDSGAVIKNVRPGENTQKLLKSILSKLNFLSGVYLVLICVASEYFCNFINQSVGENVLKLSGTAVLILVSTSKLIFDGIRQYNYEAVFNEMTVKEKNFRTEEEKKP
jgi:preprotein translocase subunit SecY